MCVHAYLAFAGFRGLHRAGNPAPGPPNPPDTVPDLCYERDFLCMDGDEVSTATMCPTTQCTTCWCPQHSLDSTQEVFDFRDTGAVCAELQVERELLLKRDGTPQDRCKEQVIIYIFLSYT
jgi:hypothetical protein